MQAASGRWGLDCLVSLRFFRLSKNMLTGVSGSFKVLRLQAASLSYM